MSGNGRGGFWHHCRQLIGTADNEAHDLPPRLVHTSPMRHWGIQDKFPLPDTGLMNGQGVYNRPLIRPAYSRFRLNRRMDFVAPDHKTPWPSVNWVPTFPMRVQQVTKSGGRAPQHPGLVTVQQMQQYNRAVPSISGGLSGFSDAVSRALYGSD